MQHRKKLVGKGVHRTDRRHLIGLRAFPGLLLVLGILVGLACSAMAGDELEVGGHSFQYLGVTNNADGTSTWTYRVSSGSKPSLSHWVLEWAESMDESLVVDASEDYEVNTDPRTGVYGIKFDQGYCDGGDDDEDDDEDDDDDEEGYGCEARIVSFTLDAWYETADTRIATKAGREIELAEWIPGPSASAISGNSDPIALDDEVQTQEQTQVKISVLENDSDPDGDSLTVESFTQAANGVVKKSGKKKVQYKPDRDFTGTDTFTYTVADGKSGMATATVTVHVGEVNDAPHAEADEAVTNENEPIRFDILVNDSDPDGSIDPTSIMMDREAGKGTVDVDPNTGFVTYVPERGAHGVDTFRYTVADNDGEPSNPATVRITIVRNQAPTAAPDVATTDADTPVAIAVTANDRDEDGTIDPGTVEISRDPKQGTLQIDRFTGLVTYTPQEGTCGSDFFHYKVSDDDGRISNPARVDIDVACNEPPVAEDDAATTDENTSIGIPILSNDFDTDGALDPTSVSIVSEPQHGSLSIHSKTGVATYTPDPDACDEDSFQYVVQDNAGLESESATVTITILCNDPPLAIDDLYAVGEGETLRVDPVGILSNDVDAPGSPLTAVLISEPRNGILVLRSDGGFTYIHDGSETTDDEFTYLASDGEKESNPATVSLVILPGNDPPIAEDDHAETEEDTPITLQVLSNDADPDHDVLSVDWISSPSHGRASNNGSNIHYTPDPDFNGSDAFSYRVSDGNGGTATASVSIEIAPVNDPPIAEDDHASTREDEAAQIPVLANDEDQDDDRLSIIEVSQPANGWVDNERTQVVYTPDEDFFGVDSFTYTAFDENGGTATATVTVHVEPVNDPPIAVDDEESAAEDTSVTIFVLFNDTDPEGEGLRVQSLEQPPHGVVENLGTSVVYTPTPNYNGNDGFSYTASDGSGGQASARVVIEVLPANDLPVAQDDTAATDEDSPVGIDVLENDKDLDGDRLQIEEVTQPEHGSVTIDGDQLRYSPDPNYSGADRFEYTLTDNAGGTASARVSIQVLPINDPPEAADDSATTDEDEAVEVLVLANDSDPDGDELEIESVQQPDHGAVENRSTRLVYLPDENFNGEDSFAYQCADGNGGTSSALVTITVRRVNDEPLAQDDSAATDEDGLVAIAVLENDLDPDGDFLTIESATDPSNGSLLLSETGITYVPESGFNGIDTFEYTVSDSNGGRSTAEVTVSVAAVNDPPVASPDSVFTEEDIEVAIQPLGNDSDPDGDPLVIQSVSQPEHGSVTGDGTELSYTPDPDFNGIDTFNYTISDGNGRTATAIVTVAVDDVNDPPVAQDDSAATAEETPVAIAVLQNDTDPDGDTLAVQSLTQPANGEAALSGSELVYSPGEGFSGIDTFTYTIEDGQGGTSSATVSVAVAAVNDAPIAVDDEETTDEDTPVLVDVRVNDSDPDGDTLSIQSLTQPANGSATINDGSISYEPNPGFNGEDAFTYTLTDGNGRTDEATVTILVSAVNDAPIAQDDTASTDEDQPVRVAVLGNDSDPDGDSLSIADVGSPANGTASIEEGELIYRPKLGFEGLDTFTYELSDGQGGADSATVTVFVAPRNDPPLAVDDTYTTVEDETVSIEVLSNDSDPDNDSLVVQSVTQPAHGAVIPSGSSIVFTPDRSFSGEDTFTYTVSDGNGSTAQATVVVTVLSSNDAPIAQDDADATSEDVEVRIDVLANDTDEDGNALTIESVTQPSGGNVTNLGSELVYEPSPGFSGVDTFTYTVSDGNGLTDVARVTISVTAANDVPVAQDDSAATAEGMMVEIPVVANDRDPDGDFLLVESFTQPENGTVLNSRTGVSYIPDSGFQGNDSFEYTVADGNGGTDTATVTIAVAGVNDVPIAQDDSAITDEGLPVQIPVLLNDSDPDGDELMIESVTEAENGSLLIAGSQVEYQPIPGFDGLETFTYTVADGNGGTATATVFIAVAAVNDAPVAQNDSASTDQNIPITIRVLENDSDPDGDALRIAAVTQPSSGTLTNTGTVLIYEPDTGFTGNDSFTYTVTDENGEIAEASVTIGVNPPIGGGGAEDAAACEGRVVISEIGWAGTPADPRDEWIELRNLGTEPVDLTGWVLRWRRTHPSSQEEQAWKFVELRGVLAGAAGAACEQADDVLPTLEFSREAGSPVWSVTSPENVSEPGYYVLERRSDATIGTLRADLIYDTTQSLQLELSDAGEVLMLLNPAGEVVDTANAANLGRDGWIAGSAVTYGSMERIDPLAPDGADNWNTNLGVMIQGEDAQDHPLRATPGVQNSPELAKAVASLEPETVRSGEQLKVSFPLPRSARLKAGWPWISVSRPGLAGSAGAGGAMTAYAFSGSYTGGDQYTLDIGTANLAPGVHEFWIIYGPGEAVYLPIIIAN